MQAEDRSAIEGLFGKLSQTEAQAPARDTEAEAFIQDRIAAQPAAPYYMAQTIVVQEHALTHAQQRIAALEAELAQRPAAGGGGLFGGLFGGSQPSPASRPQQRPAPAPQAASMAGAPQAGRPAPAQGGGFLAGAAQTAMGVAGGMLVANAIGSMFDGGDAQAAEMAPGDDPTGGMDAGGMTEDPMAGAAPEEDIFGGMFDVFGGDE